METSLATLGLLGLTTWVTYLGFKRRDVFERCVFRPDRVLRQREFHRLASSALIHVDWVHFGFNAITLASFGPVIETVYGSALLLLIYLSSVLGGSLLSLWFHRHEDYSAVGASGGVCGVVFASVFLLPGGSVGLFFLPITIPSWAYAILFLLYSFSGVLRQSDNIGHDAHLGGALVGLLVATVLYTEIVLLQWKLLVGVIGLSLGFFAFLLRWPRRMAQRVAVSGASEHQPSLRHQEYDRARDRGAARARMNELLDKIGEGGFAKLDPAEREEIEKLSKQLRR